MSNRSEPSSPSSGSGAGTRCDATTATCPEQVCPQVEIQINNTAANTDDLVQLKCTTPARSHKVSCRIRAQGGGSGSATIVLTNPDGRLRFPNPGDTTKTLSVPRSGSWVAFEISGETASNALNDAVIEAHCNTATGALKGSKTVTVFWFDQLQMNVATPGSYQVTGGQFTTTGGNAVNLSAQGRIRPAGVNCAAPQVADLRVGIMQNERPGITGEYTWGNPTIVWNAGVPAGTQVTVATTMRRTFRLPQLANDSAPTVNPLYDRPGRADTLDPNSLKPPMGCPNGAAATSNDSPSEPMPGPLNITARTAAGAAMGSVRYRLQSVRTKGSFITWMVIFNTRTNTYCALHQRPWTLDAISTGPAPQRAAAGADGAPTINPVNAPTNNALANNPANTVTGPVGGATTVFTR